MTGTWVLYIPYVKSKFGLQDSEMGVALFALSLGLLVSIPFIPKLNALLGVGRSTKWAIFVYAVIWNLPLLAPSYHMLCLSLFLVGICSGITDIAMNALVSTIEKEDDTSIMSAAHGFFSIGGFISATVGSILIARLSDPSWHMLILSVAVILSNAFLAPNYVSIQESKSSEQGSTKQWRDVRPLLGLAVIAFIIMFSEGAVEHWSNLFLHDVIHLSESQAGLGFIAFSLCMTIGRFFGDGISRRLGSIKTIATGCAVAVLGYGAIVIADFYPSVIGFGVIGLGLSVIVPEIFRLAGSSDKVNASVGISIVSGIGFAGFLVGPVVLGYISQWSNLVWSFGFLGGLVLVALVITMVQSRTKPT